MSQKKGILSRGVRLLREGCKQAATLFAGKILGERSFSLLGIPSGLTLGLGNEGGSQRLLYPSEVAAVSLPKTIELSLYHPFLAMQEGVFLAEESVLTIPKGIATSQGGNLSPQGKLITTLLQPIDGKPPQCHDLLRFSTKKFFPKIFYASQPVLTLAAGWQGAFYHWIYEVLPRLHLAEKGGYPLECIYVEANLSFQKESLALMGVADSQMINAHIYTAVSAPELIIPSISQIPTFWGCQFLREKILPQLSTRASLRLYVSRNDASRRRILNEEQVFALLSRYGFIKVQLSQFNFKEQAELFRAAEVVVGPHGAGFSHLVFCNPGTPFLEIFAPVYFNPCYWHISNRVGLNYYYLFGQGKSLEGIQAVDPDIEVDLDKLAASLKLMGIVD